MSYCTVEDVKSDFKNISFTANSSVTIDEVQAFIDQEAAYINGKICTIYKVPVDELVSPESFMILKRINIFLAADRVRHAIQVKTGMKEKDQATKGTYTRTRSPKTDLKEILNGELKLCDAIPNESNIGFDTSTEPNDCCSNTFDVNKQQW